jgi:hypothetical protein
MHALDLFAGPGALAHLKQHGLNPQDIGTIPAAAGGPKGLILGSLDRFVFGQWLPQTTHPVHLVGASIGAWRMATACLTDPVTALERLERDYIAQHYDLLPGEKRPAAARVSALFSENLQAFYGGRLPEVLQHPRYVLHVLTSHGRGLLARERGAATLLAYLGAFVSNLAARRALGFWLERVVFSSQGAAGGAAGAGMGIGPNAGAAALAGLPFDARDYPTRQLALTAVNFQAALQASCSIPFVLQAVHDIAGAPAGAYWDGGVTDYHLHLNYAGATPVSGAALVLYPHFQRSVVPGWFDKHLRWRHGATPFLDNMVLLAPNPVWVKTLPNGKLPDRGDFTHYGADLAGRTKAWRGATSAAAQLADEFADWLARPEMGRVKPL